MPVDKTFPGIFRLTAPDAADTYPALADFQSRVQPEHFTYFCHCFACIAMLLENSSAWHHKVAFYFFIYFLHHMADFTASITF